MQFKFYIILRHINKILIIVLLLLCSCAPPSEYGNGRMPRMERSKFFADPLVFYDIDSAKPRLDLNIEVPIETISFQKDYQNQIYDSKIIITVNVKNTAGEIVLTKTYNESSTYNYNEIKAKSNESQFYSYNFYVEPGGYKLSIEIKDVYLNREYIKSFDIPVKDFKSSEVSCSDLMVLSKIEVARDGTKEITPLVNDNIFGLKELNAFFEIYNNTDNAITKEYILRLKDNNDVTINESNISYQLSPNKNQKFETLFMLNRLEEYFSEDSQTDKGSVESLKSLFFKLEILDKTTGETVAKKKLLFFPDEPMHGMMNHRPPMR